MKNKELTFNEVYKLPLQVDRYCPDYIYTSNEVMALTMYNDEDKDYYLITDIINGNVKSEIKNKITYDKNNAIILFDEVPKIMIRGWGHLTGTGALNLSEEDAIKIQDDFAKFIIEKLTKN